MATRTNTLAVQVVARGEADKDVQKIADAFRRMKGETYLLENQLPKAVDANAIKFQGLKAAGAAAAASVVAIGAAVVGTTAALTAATAGAFSLAKASADLGDRALDAAQRVGTSTEFITRMGFAAKQNATSIETVEKGLRRLAQGALSGSQTFDRWGISIKNADGTLKTTEQLWVSAAEKISSIENNAVRAAAAQDIFGRAGTELLPLLSLTTEQMDALNAQSDRLGVTIGLAAAQIASDFNDALDGAKDAFTAVSREAGAVFQPALTEAFTAAQDVAAAMLGVIGENREAFEAFATKSVALVARGFALIVDTGSAASHVLEGLVSIFTNRLDPAFAGMRRLAGEVSERARDLAEDLEHGAAVTRDEVVPAVQAENTARTDLLQTLGKEKKERKSLLELTEQATFDLTAAEIALQQAMQETAQEEVTFAAISARQRRERAEAEALSALETARTIERQTGDSAAQIVALEAELARKKAAIQGEGIEDTLRRTEFVVTAQGQILTEHNAQVLALLDKESGARKVTGLEIAQNEIAATRKALAEARKAHQEKIEDLNEAKSVVQEATTAFVAAKNEERGAVEAVAQAERKRTEEEKRRADRESRERRRRFREEERAQQEAQNQAINAARSIAQAGHDSTVALIGVYRALRDETASTGDAILAVSEIFVNSGIQVMQSIAEQLAAKQAAAAGEIGADAARGASNVAASVSETTPWFVALALAPAMAATMFALIKAFAGKYHTGGDVTGGMIGEERLAVLQVGERVQSIQERRAQQFAGDRSAAPRGGTTHVTNNNTFQSLVPLQTRAAYHRTYRDSLGPSLQSMHDSNQSRLRSHKRVIGRRVVRA